jgi:hypothetical protein
VLTGRPDEHGSHVGLDHGAQPSCCRSCFTAVVTLSAVNQRGPPSSPSVAGPWAQTVAGSCANSGAANSCSPIQLLVPLRSSAGVPFASRQLAIESQPIDRAPVRSPGARLAGAALRSFVTSKAAFLTIKLRAGPEACLEGYRDDVWASEQVLSFWPSSPPC